MHRTLLCLPFILLGCTSEEDVDPAEKPIDTETTSTTSTTTTATNTTTTTTTTAASDLIGNTYAVDIGSGTWVQPNGIGALIGGLIEQDLLLGVTDVQGPDLYFMGAISDGLISQDLCATTFDTPTPADFSADPYFELIANEIVLNISGISVVVSDAAISGTFSADLGQMQDMSFAGTIDASTLDGLTGGDTCGLLGAFGVSCNPCPPPSQSNSCLAIEVTNLTGQGVPLALQPVTEADIAADPNCP